MAALVIATSACGGRSIESDGGDAGAHPSTDASTAFVDAAGVAACVSSEGVRICGGNAGCPWLDTTECPGGCTPPLDHDGTPQSAVGVCWTDAADKGAVSCAVCNDGEGCLQRTSDQLVCVPIGVCASLWSDGATTLCRYADKSSYDDRLLPPEPSSCPSNDSHAQIFCGGACGGCPLGDADRCIGRSPDHPVGICVDLFGAGDPENPSDIPTCSVSQNIGCPAEDATAVCGVFAVARTDQIAAETDGVCIEAQECQAMEAALPGGFTCIQVGGTN